MILFYVWLNFVFENIINVWSIFNGNDCIMYGFECMVVLFWVIKWWLFNGLICNLCVIVVCRFVSRDVFFDLISRSEIINWM